MKKNFFKKTQESETQKTEKQMPGEDLSVEEIIDTYNKIKDLEDELLKLGWDMEHF